MFCCSVPRKKRKGGRRLLVKRAVVVERGATTTNIRVKMSKPGTAPTTGTGPTGEGVPPLTPATIRNLGDKLYEKRKLGALEVEQLIKESKDANDSEKIQSIILYLTNHFAYSASGNQRKGGLIALAAAAIGLGQVTIAVLHHTQCSSRILIFNLGDLAIPQSISSTSVEVFHGSR